MKITYKYHVLNYCQLPIVYCQLPQHFHNQQYSIWQAICSNNNFQESSGSQCSMQVNGRRDHHTFNTNRYNKCNN